MSIKCQKKKSIAIECFSWEGQPANFHTRLCKCFGFSSDIEVAKEERKKSTGIVQELLTVAEMMVTR